jgi:hypothetical protein
LFLWVTFVTHRFILFPAWLYYWFVDQETLGLTDMVPMERYGYAATIASLFILSGVWFMKIDHEVRKAWGIGSSKRSKNVEKKTK